MGKTSDVELSHSLALEMERAVDRVEAARENLRDALIAMQDLRDKSEEQLVSALKAINKSYRRDGTLRTPSGKGLASWCIANMAIGQRMSKAEIYRRWSEDTGRTPRVNDIGGLYSDKRFRLCGKTTFERVA